MSKFTEAGLRKPPQILRVCYHIKKTLEHAIFTLKYVFLTLKCVFSKKRHFFASNISSFSGKTHFSLKSHFLTFFSYKPPLNIRQDSAPANWTTVIWHSNLSNVKITYFACINFLVNLDQFIIFKLSNSRNFDMKSWNLSFSHMFGHFDRFLAKDIY